MSDFKKWFKKYHGESYAKSLSHNGYYSADKIYLSWKQSRMDVLKEVGEFSINLGLRNFINTELEKLKQEK